MCLRDQRWATTEGSAARQRLGEREPRGAGEVMGLPIGRKPKLGRHLVKSGWPLRMLSVLEHVFYLIGSDTRG
jgi:hypothetical protein